MTAVLWTRDQVLAAVDGAEPGGLDTGLWQATGVSIDSRTLRRGDLFVALKGPFADGHDHLAAAFAAGACAAVVHRTEGVDGQAGPLIVCSDTMAALEALGRAARARLSPDARVLGVTGSVGKTGTKDMLVHALSRQGPTASTVGNLNNHWGLPLSLARTPADSRFVVLEMGMNHAGELIGLSTMARPHAAIVTTVEAVHIENFSGVEEIADAKAEIFCGLEPDGTAVINADNGFATRLRRTAGQCGVERIVTFGREADADVRLLDWTPGEAGADVRVAAFGTSLDMHLPSAGRHIALNGCGVLAMVHAAGADVASAAAALAGIEPPKGRGGREAVACGGGGTFVLIDESYNASPVAVRAALDTLALTAVADGGRRIAILGDMLELGPRAAAYHAELADICAEAGVDRVLTAGPLMRHLHDALPQALRGAHAPDAAEACGDAAAEVRAGDVVMVKGSRGSRMDLVVDALRAHAHRAAAKIAANGD
jgi:UDP-N-acetylmuramoyl-tripeptide--D-alanyl-D-alanine ligase